jgi:hypothetical protein
LRAVTGLVVLGIAVWTAASGVRLGGWFPTPGTTTHDVTAAHPGTASRPAESTAGEPANGASGEGGLSADRSGDDRQTITLRVHDSSFAPARVSARPDAHHADTGFA